MDNTEGREGRVITTVPADTFDHRLMLARSHAGRLTIGEAAMKCGLSPQNWSNWEKGKTPRDILDVIQAVSEGLGVDRDWLMYGGQLAAPERRNRPISRRAYSSRTTRPGERLSAPRRERTRRIAA